MRWTLRMFWVLGMLGTFGVIGLIRHSALLLSSVGSQAASGGPSTVDTVNGDRFRTSAQRGEHVRDRCEWSEYLMVEAKREVERAEFEVITRRLIGRAAVGRGRVAAVGGADAEDVVQDAWEKLVRQGKPFPRGDALEAHVHTALVDTSVDHGRARRRKKAVPPELVEPIEEIPEAELGLDYPHDQRLAALQARQLYESLLAIVGQDATMYAVLDALGFEEKEIASRLQISERDGGALRKRVSRARAAISKDINRQSHAPKEDH